MHVLHVLKFSPPFGGGMVEHLSALGEAARARGDAITYAFPQRQPWFEELARHGEVLELPEILRPLRSGFRRRLRRLCRERSVDILHMHFSFALPLALALGPGSGTYPVVYHWHNVPRALLPGASTTPMHPLRFLARGLARLGDRRVICRHLTVSREIRDALLAHGWAAADKVEHCPNALGRLPVGKSAADADPVRDIVVGSVASFRPQKDHATLLRAFAGVLREFPSARLALVGDGPTRKASETLSRELGIEGRVSFLGILADPAAAYRTFDVFVLSTHYEGHPLALLEAMSHGLPVVATDLPSVREVVPEALREWLVPGRDPEALSRAISRLVRDRELRRNAGLLARKTVEEQFRMERWVEQVLGIYREVLTSR